MFTEAEKSLNPQTNKNLKKMAKKQKKADKKAFKVTQTSNWDGSEDVDMGADEAYDFKQYYGQLPDEDEEM
jgi:hypothetical protein